MTQNGQPDNPRASRYILKDFVNGRLLYCVAPPSVPQEEYHKFKQKLRKPVQMTAQAERAVRVSNYKELSLIQFILGSVRNLLRCSFF